MLGKDEFPIAFGVIRAYDAPAYDEDVEAQFKDVQAKKKEHTLRELLLSGETWEVK